MTSDDDLVERTLAFAGTHVSDDGNVTIRRADAGANEYSGDRFVGICNVCCRGGLMPPTGAPLPHIQAAVRFAAEHRHGDGD